MVNKKATKRKQGSKKKSVNKKLAKKKSVKKKVAKKRTPKLTDNSKKRRGRLPKLKSIHVAKRGVKKPKKSSKPKVLRGALKSRIVPITSKKQIKDIKIDMSDIERIKKELLNDSEHRTKILYEEEKRIERDMRKYYVIFIVILIILFIIFFWKIN